MDFLKRQKDMFTEQELDLITDLTVLIAGVGGLGTHQAVELQRAGVKKIYLLDSDKIEVSNLNRQILYGRADVGKLKSQQAKKALVDFNLGTEVVAITEELDETTEIPEDVDIILDAFDNFASRYQLEELAAKQDLAMVHGGISSWHGQITTIMPNQTPTLKEIIGAEDDDKVIPAFSPVVSIIASLQVIEAFKVMLNKENNLVNKILMVDLSDYSIREISL